MYSDVKKRRSFLALLFAAGDLRRSAIIRMRRKRHLWLCCGVVISIASGYAWTLLSLFVLPSLFGDVSYAPGSSPNPVGDFLMGQSVYGGCLIVALGVALSIRWWRKFR